MIPNRQTDIDLTEDFEVESLPTRTYRVQEGRIVGFVDGIDAMKQAILGILTTERYKFPIYSHSYGLDPAPLEIDDRDLLISEYKRLITEALKSDDRVLEVDGFTVEKVDSRSALLRFNVETVFGSVNQEVEVV